MMNSCHEIRELSLDALEAVIGAGQTVGFNEQVAHFLSVHERTSVVDSLEPIPRRIKKK